MASWPQPLVILYAFAVGAVVGSFLNVLIWRVPRRMSIVRPASHCPACSVPIRWFDNVPILSWLVLGGRCRSCRGRIAARYPLVESAGGLLAVAALLRYGVTLAGLEALVFSWISLALGLIDLEHQLLPDVMTYPSIAFLLRRAWGSDLSTPLGALVEASRRGDRAYKLVRDRGDGLGTSYLAAIGAVVGLRDCLWVLVVAAARAGRSGVDRRRPRQRPDRAPLRQLPRARSPGLALPAVRLDAAAAAAVGRGDRRLEVALLVGQHGAQVEHDGVVLDPPDHRRLAEAEGVEQALAPLEGEPVARPVCPVVPPPSVARVARPRRHAVVRRRRAIRRARRATAPTGSASIA
jgi:leader peptidase (prepilin peptidase)/N-methyltransferase